MLSFSESSLINVFSIDSIDTFFRRSGLMVFLVKDFILFRAEKLRSTEADVTGIVTMIYSNLINSGRQLIKSLWKIYDNISEGVLILPKRPLSEYTTLNSLFNETLTKNYIV